MDLNREPAVLEELQHIATAAAYGHRDDRSIAGCANPAQGLTGPERRICAVIEERLENLDAVVAQHGVVQRGFSPVRSVVWIDAVGQQIADAVGVMPVRLAKEHR